MSKENFEDVIAKMANDELGRIPKQADQVKTINNFIQKYSKKQMQMAIEGQDVTKLDNVLTQAHELRGDVVKLSNAAYAAVQFRSEIERTLGDLSNEKIDRLHPIDLEAKEQILQKAKLTDLSKQPGSDGRPLVQAIDDKLKAIDTRLRSMQINFADGSHRPARSSF